MSTVTRTGKTISGITNSSDPVATCVAHGLTAGQTVILMGALFGASGALQVAPLDGQVFTVAVPDVDHFQLLGADTSALAAWASGGEVLLTPATTVALSLTTIEKVKGELNLTGRAVTAISAANPGVVTCVAHEFQQNDEVVISKVRGMTELNGVTVVVTPIDADHFSIGIDTSAYTAYAGGGFAAVEDVYLAEQIVDQSAFFIKQMGRASLALPQEQVEVRSGDGGRSVTPYILPIQSVVSVTIDNQVVPRRPFPGEPGWMWDNNRVMLDDYATGNPFPGDYAPYYVDGSRWRFTRGVGNVVIRYLAGVAVPDDVSRAVTELVAYRYRNRDRIGLRSRSLPGGQGGELVTYMVDAIPPSVQAVLERYYVPSIS